MAIHPNRPHDHGRGEGATMRVLFALVVMASVPGLDPRPFFRGPEEADLIAQWLRFTLPFTGQPQPNGLAHWIDFTFLADPGPVFFGLPLYGLLRLGAAAALVAYALGVVPWLALPYLAALMVAIGTLNNSQGSITHHYQGVALVLVALALFYAGLRAVQCRRRILPAWWQRDRWAAFVAQQVLVGAYVVSALSKLIYSEGRWFADTRLFPIQLVKTERMHYFNSLVEPDAKSLPLVERVVEPLRELVMVSPPAAMLVLGTGLLLELFAFVMLFGRAWAVLGAVVLIFFHLSVGTLMNLHFEENIALLLTFFIVPHLVAAVAAWSVRRTRTAS